ncbi:MAG: hypothetical protein HS104_32790 [Polyangiaceae bacterium]|nr:hypothetical protein [Polyangiaceae bacterium]
MIQDSAYPNTHVPLFNLGLLAFLAGAATAQAEPEVRSRDAGSLWARGTAGPAYLAGTYSQTEDSPAGRRTYAGTVDGPGAELSFAAGPLLAPALGIGGYLDIGMFGAGTKMGLTTASMPYQASLGVLFSLAATDELYSSASVGAAQVGWLSGSRAAVAGAPRLAGRLRGPLAALSAGWFGGSLGFEGRLAYSHVFGDDADLESLIFGIAFAAQHW